VHVLRQHKENTEIMNWCRADIICLGLKAIVVAVGASIWPPSAAAQSRRRRASAAARRHYRPAALNVFICLTALLLLPMTATAGAEPKLWPVIVFGSQDCPSCLYYQQFWQQQQSPRPMLVVDVERPEVFDLLMRLEDLLGDVPEQAAFPAVYADGVLAYAQQIEPLLRRALAAVPTLLPESEQALLAAIGALATAETVPPPISPVAAAPRYAAYFYIPGCRKCSRAEVALRYLQTQLPGLTTDRYDISTTAGLAALQRVRQHFAMTDSAQSNIPMLAWADGWALLQSAKLPQLVDELDHSATTAFWQAPNQPLALPQFSLALIIVGGLIDGVNPCAFASVIFLMSYLALLGRRRAQIFRLGACFCLGVFTMYLLLGLGLLHVLEHLQKFAFVTTLLYGVMAVASLLLAGLHLRDAYRCRCHGPQALVMGLSSGTRRRINAAVRTVVRSRWLLAGGLVLGAIVSILELACTGQIYLPMLIAIHRLGINLRSLLALLSYNLAFILPLVGVTLVSGFGVKSQRLAKLAQQHLVLAKLLMALVLLLLAGLMAWFAATSVV